MYIYIYMQFMILRHSQNSHQPICFTGLKREGCHKSTAAKRYRHVSCGRCGMCKVSMCQSSWTWFRKTWRSPAFRHNSILHQNLIPVYISCGMVFASQTENIWKHGLLGGFSIFSQKIVQVSRKVEWFLHVFLSVAAVPCTCCYKKVLFEWLHTQGHIGSFFNWSQVLTFISVCRLM